MTPFDYWIAGICFTIAVLMVGWVVLLERHDSRVRWRDAR